MTMTQRSPSANRARLGTSRVAAVPTTVPAAPPSDQLSLPDTTPAEGPGDQVEVLPGVVHIPRWLSLEQQADLVADFRRWALPPAGLRHPRMPTGAVMSLQSVCLGWHWQPYRYSRTADDTDGAPVEPMPAGIVELSRRAVQDAYGESPTARSYAPDAAIVNLYAPRATLGLHADAEEPSDAPVVTISLGETATFRFAAVDRRTGPFTDLWLASGDLLVFGGPGVPKVLTGTAPAIGLPPGRLSITVRETGLA